MRENVHPMSNEFLFLVIFNTYFQHYWSYFLKDIVRELDWLEELIFKI